MLSCADALDAAGHRNASAALRLTAAEVSLRLGDRPAADAQLALLASMAAGWSPARRRHCAGRCGRSAGGVRGGAGGSGGGGPGEGVRGSGDARACCQGRRAAGRVWAGPRHGDRAGPYAPGLGRAVAGGRRGHGPAALTGPERAAGGARGGRPGGVRPPRGRAGCCRGHPGSCDASPPRSFRGRRRATVRLRYGLRRTHLLDGRVPEPAAEAAALERLLFGPLLGPLRERRGGRSGDGPA